MGAPGSIYSYSVPAVTNPVLGVVGVVPQRLFLRLASSKVITLEAFIMLHNLSLTESFHLDTLSSEALRMLHRKYM